MKQYDSFNAEALELSQSLPEEQSQLYKKHFIPLPLEKLVGKMVGSDGGEGEVKTLERLATLIHERLKIKTDAVIGSTRHVIRDQNNTALQIINIEELDDDRIAKKLYKSAEDRLVATIHAYARRVIFIRVPDGQKVALNLLFVNTDIPNTVQVFVDIGKEAKLELFEWYASETKSESLMATLHEVWVGPYSDAEISLVHNEDVNTYVVGFMKGKVLDNGRLRTNYIYNGGSISRIKNDLAADGHNAKTEVTEIVIGSGDQKFDINTIIANMQSDTFSELESKAALMDKSICFLKGFAIVGENAPGSRSFVHERGILLDKRAHMSSIPGMSINNANVKATHSSATAPMEEDPLFYLMSRGADETLAKKLLIAGFFSSSIAKMGSSLAKSAVFSLMNEKINTHNFGIIPNIDISSAWFDNPSGKGADLFKEHYKYRDLK